MINSAEMDLRSDDDRQDHEEHHEGIGHVPDDLHHGGVAEERQNGLEGDRHEDGAHLEGGA